MLEDGSLRESFEADVLEMEAMVTQTLEFMRGLNNREPGRNIDIVGLLEGLQADNEAMGRTVIIAGQVSRPCFGPPQLLRRCLANLIDNAAIYGQRADVSFGESAAELTIRIRDHGPGIPEDELETVFEPFYRLERSRSRETGGTGLGLAIARSIAQAQGGDVRLRNHPDGGLEAILDAAVAAATGHDLNHEFRLRAATRGTGATATAVRPQSKSKTAFTCPPCCRDWTTGLYASGATIDLIAWSGRVPSATSAH